MPIELIEPYTNVEGLNFDLVTVPVWADHPNVAPTAPPQALNISKYSKHKDAAWAVVAYLASEEGQLVRSRDGFVPVTKNQETISQFGASQLEKTGKTFNLTAPFTQVTAKLPEYSVYGPNIIYSGPDFIDNSTSDFMTSDKDIVSFLREMDDKYAAEIKELIGKN
ncbi:extracellular solute-binding protein [Paenibacillus durus]|nr:extracellular solute-binding protein [Paenibacillus durus]